jgi:hypothetical protein
MEDLLILSDDGKTVTGIKDKNAIRLSIPEGVTCIGRNAFRNCTSLESINISSNSILLRFNYKILLYLKIILYEMI